MLAGNFLYCQPAFSRLAAKARNRHPALWKRNLDRSFESQRRIQADMGINNQCFGCHFLRLLSHGYSFNTFWRFYSLVDFVSVDHRSR
jgi:hypothetical protein